MELIASILTGLLGVVGAPGIVLDRTVTDLVRQQIYGADVLEVRVDNTPNYQILFGKVDRLRLASRGLYIVPFLRIDTLELETDPIDIDPASLQPGSKLKLRRPLQAAVKVILKSADLNQALRSPQILQAFPSLKVDLGAVGGKGTEEVILNNPEITFLGGNRLRLAATITPKNSSPNTSVQPLRVSVEANLSVVNGTRLQLINPNINLQGVNVPNQLTQTFTEGLNRLLDLSQLEQSGITARVLKFEITDGDLQVIGFASMEAIR
jgi:LmeA-like phospholipid-binding